MIIFFSIHYSTNPHLLMFSESDVICINSQKTGLYNVCPDTVWVQCNTHLLHLCNVEGTSGQIRVRWNSSSGGTSELQILFWSSSSDSVSAQDYSSHHNRVSERTLFSGFGVIHVTLLCRFLRLVYWFWRFDEKTWSPVLYVDTLL